MKKIDEIIGDSKTVGIAGHVRPDGDCNLRSISKIYRSG